MVLKRQVYKSGLPIGTQIKRIQTDFLSIKSAIISETKKQKKSNVDSG